MTKQRVAFNSFDFRIYKREYFSFNLMVVAFDNLFEIVGANCVSERIDFRDGLVGLHLRRNLCRIHNNLSVEDLLFDTFVEVVGYRTYEHTLCEVTDFGCWNETVHLCGDRGGFVVAVDGHGLSLLKYLTKPFGKRLSRLTDYLPGKNISHRILNHLAFFVSIVTCKLRKVLKAQTYRYLVETFEKWGGQ